MNFIWAFALLVAGSVCAEEEHVARSHAGVIPLPSKAQLNYQKQELIAITLLVIALTGSRV